MFTCTNRWIQRWSSSGVRHGVRSAPPSLGTPGEGGGEGSRGAAMTVEDREETSFATTVAATFTSFASGGRTLTLPSPGVPGEEKAPPAPGEGNAGASPRSKQ